MIELGYPRSDASITSLTARRRPIRRRVRSPSESFAMTWSCVYNVAVHATSSHIYFGRSSLIARVAIHPSTPVKFSTTHDAHGTLTQLLSALQPMPGAVILQKM